MQKLPNLRQIGENDMNNNHRHIGVGCAVFLVAAAIFLFVLVRFLLSGYLFTVPAPHMIFTQSTAAPAPQSRVDCGAVLW